MNKEITKLRERAEAIGCRVRIFRRRDYKCCGKPILYSLMYDQDRELYASSLAELLDRIQIMERRAERAMTPLLTCRSAAR